MFNPRSDVPEAYEMSSLRHKHDIMKKLNKYVQKNNNINSQNQS